MFLGLFAINLLISTLALFILPDKYFNDTKIIVIDKWHEIGWVGSYPFAIMFYKLTALKYLPFPVVAIVQYPILMYILYKIGVSPDFYKINVKNVLVYIGFFLLALYASMPSKEFITFIYIALVPYIFIRTDKSLRYKVTATMLLIAFFGSFFRHYYLLIPIIAIGMYMATFIKLKNKSFSVVFYGLLIAIFLSFSHGIVNGEYLSKSTREDYTDEQKVALKINSVIESPISQDTWYGESFGIVYGFLAVNLPIIEGMKHLMAPQIVAFIIWQLCMFYILFVRFSKVLKDKKKYELELWIFLILIAYFIVQGIFEPDLGTSIRHKIGFFPLIYYLLYYEKFNKRLQTNS